MESKTTLKATDFIRSVARTAHHFGFRPLEELKEDARCKNCAKVERPKILATQKRIDALQGALANGISSYFDHNLHGLGEPALFYTIDETSKKDEVIVSLQILGIDKSIAEALLIHTVRSLFAELELREHTLRINSIGDRESMNRYVRELGNYLRKRIDTMPGAARELMKEHSLTALMHLIERGHELGLKSPSSLEYLNETSRKHFREIIEYLDLSETPYEIDTKLLGHHECYSQTLFSFESFTDETREIPSPIKASGGRYDEFVFQMTKKHIPAVGAVISLKGQNLPARIPRYKVAAPSVFMIQLGFGPKLRSLLILEELKKADIPVYQLLSSDSLSAQLEGARSHNVPYTIILGQKEYVENSVIVRNMRNSSQESVPLPSLVSHLRKAIKA